MGSNSKAAQLLEQQAHIESKWVLQSPFLQVRQDIVTKANKSPQIWNIAILPGSVAIVPINAKEEIILVEQWRRAVKQITLELPAGMLDPEESPEVCAQRELQEETGYYAHDLRSLGHFFSSPGVVCETVHLFIGKNLEFKPLIAEDTTGIDVKTFSVKEALYLIKNQAICDAKTIVGILRYAQSG